MLRCLGTRVMRRHLPDSPFSGYHQSGQDEGAHHLYRITSQISAACLDFAFIAIENMHIVMCNPHQLVDVGVMFLFCTSEHAYVICNSDSASAQLYDMIHHLPEHVLA